MVGLKKVDNENQRRNKPESKIIHVYKGTASITFGLVHKMDDTDILEHKELRIKPYLLINQNIYKRLSTCFIQMSYKNHALFATVAHISWEAVPHL